MAREKNPKVMFPFLHLTAAALGSVSFACGRDGFVPVGTRASPDELLGLAGFYRNLTLLATVPAFDLTSEHSGNARRTDCCRLPPSECVGRFG